MSTVKVSKKEKKVYHVFYNHEQNDICHNIQSVFESRYFDIDKLIFIDLVLAGGEDRRHEILQQIHRKSKEVISRSISRLLKDKAIYLRSRANKHDESSITSYEIV